MLLHVLTVQSCAKMFYKYTGKEVDQMSVGITLDRIEFSTNAFGCAMVKNLDSILMINIICDP